MPNKQIVIRIPKINLWIFSLSILAIYVGSILFLAYKDQNTFNALILFDAQVKNIFTLSFFAKGLIAFFSLILLALPGFIWTLVLKNEFKDSIHLLARILAMSLFLLILSSMVFKLFSPFSIDRTSLIVIIITLIFSGLLFLGKKQKITITLCETNHKRAILAQVIIGFILVLSIFLLFHGKFLNEDLNGDALEGYVFANSLKTHVLSYGSFDMFEPSHEGIYISNPFFIDSYINMFFLNLFGETESSIRLDYLISILLVYIILCAFDASKTLIVPPTL